MYTEHIKSIGMEHLKRMLESAEKFLLIDVRSKEDYAKEHIKHAKSIPLDELEKEARQSLKPDDNIITYCDSYVCSASASAAAMLMRMGYKNVRDYKGGIREWKTSNLPVESGP